MTNRRKIAFIGAGNMNRSIINGLIQSGYPSDDIYVSNPSNEKLEQLREELGVHISQNNSEVAALAEVIVLGVKPQIMEAACADLHQHTDLTGKLFISVAAGLTIERIQQMLAGNHTVIRTMPNTPSLLGLGMTGLYANSEVTADDKDFAEQMMKAVGKIIWVENESGIDAITAAAGSGPAYFFLFMEAMQNKAIEQGFSEAQAREVIQQVALGAANMVTSNPQLSLQELRQRVTSKGGTTAAAIETFEAAKLESIISSAMQAATDRAQEMAKQF